MCNHDVMPIICTGITYTLVVPIKTAIPSGKLCTVIPATDDKD